MITALSIKNYALIEKLAINFSNPWVIQEIDKGKAQTIIATFGTSTDALIDILSGAFNPTGKCRFQRLFQSKRF